jgi:hypothetical protein
MLFFQGVKLAASLKMKIVVAFAAVYLIWDFTYLAIKFVEESLPPFSEQPCALSTEPDLT